VPRWFAVHWLILHFAHLGCIHHEQPAALAPSAAAGFANRSSVQFILVAVIYAKRIKSVKCFDGLEYSSGASATQETTFLLPGSRRQTVNIRRTDVASFEFPADSSQPVSGERIFRWSVADDIAGS
jgi:hypothetical protein